MKVHTLFNGIPYDGSIVNMGVKNPDGSVCYIIDVLKAIRNKLNKHDGDRKKTWFVVKDKFSMRYSRRLSKVYGTWYQGGQNKIFGTLSIHSAQIQVANLCILSIDIPLTKMRRPC